MVTAIQPKPKPVRVPKKANPYCQCRYLYANRDNYRMCAKCGRQVKEKNYRKILEVAAHGIVKEIVLLRDGFCVCSPPENGHSEIMQPGHLISRIKEGVTFDLYNVNKQCKSCNRRHEDFWYYYDTWFDKTFGTDERKRLEFDADHHIRYTIIELEELLRQLTAIHSRQLEDKTFKPRFSQKDILSGEWRKHGDQKSV